MEQRKLIYSVIVAGKTAKFAQSITAKLFDDCAATTPFEEIAQLIKEDRLDARLREVRSGNYTKLCKCLPELIKIDPATVTLEELEAIHGVGPKTARFFLLWTRPDYRCAALDVHVLRFLAAQGIPNVPKQTPSAGPTYRRLEKEFLRIADERGVTPSQLDAEVWAAGANVPVEGVWTTV